MHIHRRNIIKACAVIPILLKVGFITSAQAAKWNKKAFQAKSLAEVLNALGGSAASTTEKINLIAPEIAENGAVVGISVESKIPNTKKIAILVEKNPQMTAGIFTFTEDSEPFVGVNIKMQQTSNITALALADGKWSSTTKEVKVTLSGCGG